MSGGLSRGACILLSTYNGERYLRQQLDSLLCQGADVLARDDGSVDGTRDILDEYASAHPLQMKVVGSEGNVGVARSFALLLKHAIDKSYDYYFFSDQDDVWLPEKCARAVEAIGSSEQMSLYFSKKRIVNSNLEPLDITDQVVFTGSVWDCFKRSNASGCTMCLSRGLAEKVALNDFVGVIYLHDAYILRLAFVIGAHVFSDDWESILYRQHQNNVVGYIGNTHITDVVGAKSRQARKHYMQKLLSDILRLHSDDLPCDNLRLLNVLVKYDASFANRLEALQYIATSRAPFDVKGSLLLKIVSNVL